MLVRSQFGIRSSSELKKKEEERKKKKNRRKRKEGHVQNRVIMAIQCQV